MSDPKVQKARQELKEALLEEQKAQSELDNFSRTTPLPPMEDGEGIPADALRRAQERKKAATEQRRNKHEKYHELLHERDELDR